ncbi:MAG: hypothetical protein WA414_10080, partial [Acidobacteriaceae bacterium]
MNSLRSSLLVWVGVLAVCAFGQTASDVSGPIRLDAGNPHYFRYRGKTVALVTSGEHYGAVLNTAFDGEKYLAALTAAGLNETRLFGGSYVEVPGKSFGIARNDLAPGPGDFVAPWARSATAGYAGGGNKFDLEQWDPEYFARLHDFLAEAQRRGIVVEISLFSSQYGEAQWELSPFAPANNVNGVALDDWKKVNTLENGKILGFQEAYVRKLVRAVNGFDNVIFEIQNEPWSDRPVRAGMINPYLVPPARDMFPNTLETADGLSLAWQTAVAGWITDEEARLPQKHLIAECITNFKLPVGSVIPGVSVANFHYAYPEAAAWNSGLGKAIAYDETGFLGREDAAYRRQAWNFMLSGGGAFDALDYSFSPGHEDGSDTAANGPGGGSDSLRKELGVLSRFLQALPLRSMQPDASSVVHAGGAVPRVLAWAGHTYAIY